MIPEINQHVKCFIRNSTVLEGTVEEWNNDQVVLKSLDGESLLILHRPLEDLMLTKIVLAEHVEEIVEENVQQPISEIQQMVKDKLQQVQEPSGDQDLDKMNIEELKALVMEQERQLIINKRKEHFGSPNNSKRLVQYSVPPINKLVRSAYAPGKLPHWVK